MSDNFLNVSEAFYSIQGEGITQGNPSYFIRLTGCNLECGLAKEDIAKAKKETWSQEKVIENKLSSASWVCDSIAVWLHGKKMSFDELIEHLGGQNFLGNLAFASIIFTGGEPLLHQERILLFLKYLYTRSRFRPTIEIETNGTILPRKEFESFNVLFNVSAKLSNSGMDYHRRINDIAINYFNDSNTLSIFKFVVNSREDVLEIINEYISPFNLLHSKIVLMPGADNRQDLIKTSELVVNLCLEFGFKFSNRNHLMIWDQKTGV